MPTGDAWCSSTGLSPLPNPLFSASPLNVQPLAVESLLDLRSSGFSPLPNPPFSASPLNDQPLAVDSPLGALPPDPASGPWPRPAPPDAGPPGILVSRPPIAFGKPSTDFPRLTAVPPASPP
ncbi:hypothetical protein GCM10009565_53190 [Amycolatopsis albidoflavus]